MIRGQRWGEFGAALLLGLALYALPPGCKEKPAASAGGGDARSKSKAVMEGSMDQRVTSRSVVSAQDRKRAGALYKQARSAWLAGKCEQAIRLAQQANALSFSTRHISIIGACACSLRRQAQAEWAYRLLRGAHRNMLVQVCKSKGIILK